MESASPSENPPQHSSSRFAHLVGVLVALLTLTLPIMAIAKFSPSMTQPPQLPTYPMSQSRD
ncbi:MAG: hypothetical protein IGR92_04305 [Leptolyngbyaceae cyanobacterium T60_A2020_046]|nr:hypothetical protein [Leptolyngbyaceae cyanobacterium T60_A2020_046]